MFFRLSFLILLAFAALPAQAKPAILVFGDSLSAGFGLPQRNRWVTLLERKLVEDGYDYRVVNASISGETTVGGKNRIENTLRKHKPEIVIVQLGANDGLRGARVADIRRNLSTIVGISKRSGAKVLVVGMEIPPNYGPDYTSGFYASFPEVARQHEVALVPFMLDGFAGNRALFQDDGIHPNLEAQPLVLDNIYRHLEPLLIRPSMH
ncbi:MAG TPA: arylesterase [Burkholderiales bacterium]|nr:arylesterase [Burkholderiales bacterium]